LWTRLDTPASKRGIMDRRLNSYARQKLCEALGHLVGEGPLRLRLTYVVHPISQLIASGSVSDDALLAKLVAIRDELTKTKIAIDAGYDHYLPRSHLTPRRAKEIAREILDLYTRAQGGI
jgi:hypothetical protein